MGKSQVRALRRAHIMFVKQNQGLKITMKPKEQVDDKLYGENNKSRK